jgi:uncharacterized membrane protein YuzA (DUF378 family)
MRAIYVTCLVLVIIGAINWGLVGFFRFDFVAALFGGQTAVASRIIYAIVGIAGLVVAVNSPTLNRTAREASRASAHR